MLAYLAVVEFRTPEQVADFDAYLDDRELPSKIAKQADKARESAEFIEQAGFRGGEVG